MIDSQFGAPADGGLHAAHRARLEQCQGKPALTLLESATLLGADPPRRHSNQESTILPAAPALVELQCWSLVVGLRELLPDVRDRVHARAVQEQPLVRGGPADQQPAAVGRPDDASERAGAGEEQPPAAAGCWSAGPPRTSGCSC